MDDNKQKQLKNTFFDLFKWRMDKEELKNQVENYNTLGFLKSSRKIATALIIFSAILVLIFGKIGWISLQTWIDTLLVLIILTFFVYKGNRWAMLPIMIYLTVFEGLQVLDSFQFLNFGPSSIGWSIWWVILMGALWQAYQVEEYKEKDQENKSVENKIKEEKTTIIGWYNKSSDSFLCSKCYINMKEIDKEKYEPITKESLENYIYTCDKCGKVFNGISTKEEIKKTIAMIFGILASIIIIFYGFSMFYMASYPIFFWSAFLLLTLGISAFCNSIKLKKSNTFKNSRNLIYMGIPFIVLSLYESISMYFKSGWDFVFSTLPFLIIGFLSISAGFLGIDIDEIKRKEYYFKKRKRFFKILRALSLLILLFLIGFTIFNIYTYKKTNYQKNISIGNSEELKLDGRIIFAEKRSGGIFRLCMVDLSNPKEINYFAENGRGPLWGPDGKNIFYYKWTEEGYIDTVIYNTTDGTKKVLDGEDAYKKNEELRKIQRRESDLRKSTISPDEKRIVSVSATGTVYLLNNHEEQTVLLEAGRPLYKDFCREATWYSNNQILLLCYLKNNKTLTKERYQGGFYLMNIDTFELNLIIPETNPMGLHYEHSDLYR